MTCARTSACVPPAYVGSDDFARSLLIPATAPVRLLASTSASAAIRMASSPLAMGIGDVINGYFVDRQMRVTRSCPAAPASTTFTRGSGTPPTVRLRKDGSTEEYRPRYICVFTRFSRRAFAAEYVALCT